MTSPRLEMTRPSDAERDRALDILREGAGSGRLSHDTFVRRMQFVLGAQSRTELEHATSDLPRSESKLVNLLRRIVAEIPRLTVTPRGAVPAAVVSGLALPRPGSAAVRIGRGPGATLRLGDITVSRFHAELRQTGEVWVLTDLGSLNGTHLNGLRIISPVQVRAGDHVRFGAVSFRLTWADPR